MHSLKNKKLLSINNNTVKVLHKNRFSLRIKTKKASPPKALLNNGLITASPPLTYECSRKWKSKFSIFKKIPHFIFCISLVEAGLHFLMNNNLKRSLLYDAKSKKEVWRFFTYTFVHTDLIHLLSNIFIQIILGIPLELEQDHWRCALVYLAGVLAGSAGVAAFSPHTLLAGASGGIYSLLTSHFPNMILNYEEIKHLWFRVVAVLVLIVFDVFHVFYHVWFYNNENPIIGWVAHVFGGVSGVTIGFLIFTGTCKWKTEFRLTFSFVLLFLTTVLFTRFIINNLSI